MALDPSGELDEWSAAFLDEASTTVVVVPVTLGWVEDRGPADVRAFAMSGTPLGAFPTRAEAKRAVESHVSFMRSGEVVVGDHVVDARRWHRN